MRISERPGTKGGWRKDNAKINREEERKKHVVRRKRKEGGRRIGGIGSREDFGIKSGAPAGRGQSQAASGYGK